MTTRSRQGGRSWLFGWPGIGCAAALAVILALNGAGLARASTLVTITIPDRHGEIPSKWLSYPGPPRADVLLPAGYSAHKRYPLLVLLSGLGNDYASYAANGADPLFDSLHAIVVVPEGGNGWYTDWWNNGERGNPAWESYELNEVLPAVLRRFRILPERRYHAIAGVSMGGLGAAYLGGRLPGFFGSVATLSGFVDTEYYAQVVDPGMGAASYAIPNGDDDPDPVDGPPDGFYMTGHNPTALPLNLKQTRVFESTGTGAPSNAGLSAPTAVPEGSALESVAIYPMNQRYVQALRVAGVDVTYQVHPGGHDIPDFIGEIESMLAWGMFKPVVTDPSSWVNDTVATSGQLWDIAYRFAKPPDRVVRFRWSRGSLSITAAGSGVTITTSRGCEIRTPTPASISISRHRCRLTQNRPSRRAARREIGAVLRATRNAAGGGRPAGRHGALTDGETRTRNRDRCEPCAQGRTPRGASTSTGTPRSVWVVQRRYAELLAGGPELVLQICGALGDPQQGELLGIGAPAGLGRPVSRVAGGRWPRRDRARSL